MCEIAPTVLHGAARAAGQHGVTRARGLPPPPQNAAREMSAEQRRQEAQAQAEETMQRYVAATRELGSLRSERKRLLSERDRKAGEAARLRTELQAHKLEISSVARTVAAMAGPEGEGGAGAAGEPGDTLGRGKEREGWALHGRSGTPQRGEQRV